MDHDAEALLASIHLSAIATVVTDARDAENPICAVNHAFEQLTGYAADEIIGRNCRFLRGEGSDDAASAILRDAIARRAPAMAEILNYRRDGTPFRNAVMVAPVFGESGEIRFFVGSQMEISAPASGGERMRDAQNRLESLSGRQHEVLRLMAKGFLNKQIAFELGISEKTVKMHRAALLTRLQARASADAVRLAVEAGL